MISCIYTHTKAATSGLVPSGNQPASTFAWGSDQSWSRSLLIDDCPSSRRSHCSRVEKHTRVCLVCLSNLHSVVLVSWWELEHSGMSRSDGELFAPSVSAIGAAEQLKWCRGVSRISHTWAGWSRPQSASLIHFHFHFLDMPTWVDADGTAQPVQRDARSSSWRGR